MPPIPGRFREGARDCLDEREPDHDRPSRSDLSDEPRVLAGERNAALGLKAGLGQHVQRP